MTSKSNYDSKDHEGKKRIIIYDTTLRDGNQSAYGTMYPSEKIAIAKRLEEVGVDIIEAGFAVSNGDGENMQAIAETLRRPYISGLARCDSRDIDKTYEVLKNYDKKMIHVFIATSKIHMQKKLKKTPEQVIEMARAQVKYAKQYFEKIEFSAEDASRSNIGFLKEIISEVINSGATTINIPDTVGCAYPSDFGKLIYKINKYIRAINPEVILSVHCHNDRGLALINTLEGITNGARQVEVTVNGLGERSGNCALEQIAANSIIKGSKYLTGIDLKKLYNLSKMVETATDVKNDMMPIVGKTSFAHKSGIHQHGVIRNTKTYEIFSPEIFGRKSEIIIGPHSGYNGMIAKAEELGFNIDENCARKALEIVSQKVREEQQKRFKDEDLKIILQKILNN